MEMNPMLKETLSYPDLIEELCEPMRKEAERVASLGWMAQVDTIYLYGSGDSLNTAVCVAQAFWDYAKIPAYAVPALTMSRYIAPAVTRERASKTLAVCISTSGEASRSVEAAMAAQKAGFLTMAVTAAPDSRVGRNVSEVFCAKIPPYEKPSCPIPGVRSFAVPTVALLQLAIALGEGSGAVTPEKAEQLRSALYRQGGLLREAFRDGGAVLASFAKRCAETERMEFIASGPLRGATDFGRSKVLEAQGFAAESQDTEEFAHQTFFYMNTEALPTVLLVSAESRSLTRTKEILYVLRRLNRPVLVLTDDASVVPDHREAAEAAVELRASGADAPTIGSAADQGAAPDSAPYVPVRSEMAVVALKERVPEDLLSLTYACLMTYLSAVMPRRAGDTFMHGHLGIYREEDIPTVRTSAIDVWE